MPALLFAQAVRAQEGENALSRLLTVETALSFYENGDGARLWLEDLRRLEAAWERLSPQTRREFCDFLLPIYMRETMGIALFEDDENVQEWMELAEKFLFDDSF